MTRTPNDNRSESKNIKTVAGKASDQNTKNQIAATKTSEQHKQAIKNKN